MRHITLAAAALAALALAGAAYADSNYGPRKNKDGQCFNSRGVSTMDSLGYWGKCQSEEERVGGASAKANAAKAKAKANGKSKTANAPTTPTR